MSLAEELRAAISFKDNETDHRVACVVLTNLPAILAALEAQEEPRKGERRLLPHYGRLVRAQRRKVAGTKEQREAAAVTKMPGQQHQNGDGTPSGLNKETTGAVSEQHSASLPDRIDVLLSGVPDQIAGHGAALWVVDAIALLREAAKELR